MLESRSKLTLAITKTILVALLVEHLFCALLHHENHHHDHEAKHQTVCHHESEGGPDHAHPHQDDHDHVKPGVQPPEPCSDDHNCDHCVGHHHIAWKRTIKQGIDQLTNLGPVVAQVADFQEPVVVALLPPNRLRERTLHSEHPFTVLLI